MAIFPNLYGYIAELAKNHSPEVLVQGLTLRQTIATHQEKGHNTSQIQRAMGTTKCLLVLWQEVLDR